MKNTNKMNKRDKINKINKTNKGFSLLELMIALVIIALISSFAIPLYNNYVIRTKITEVTNVARLVGNKVLECLIFNGNDYQLCNSFSEIELDSNSIETKQIEAVAFDDEAVEFTVSLHNTGDTDLDTLAIEYTIADLNQSLLQWQCKISNSTGNKYVPNNCKNNE